jgi:hypothetical protein
MAIIFLNLFTFASLVFSFQCAVAFGDSEAEEPGKVEVNYSADQMATYKDRRSPWSVTFGFNVEQIYLSKYRSELDGATYEDLFGDTPIDLFQAELGAKYNLSFGSIGAAFRAGYGEIFDRRIASIVNQDTDATLTLMKYSAVAGLYLDTLFSEPYFVPYVEGEVYTFNWLEEAKNTPEDILPYGSTAPAFAFRFGGLIQLNWLDPDSAFTAMQTSGLENTFLDIFVSYYSPSSQAFDGGNTAGWEYGNGKDPDFTSEYNFGAGLKLEF